MTETMKFDALAEIATAESIEDAVGRFFDLTCDYASEPGGIKAVFIGIARLYTAAMTTRHPSEAAQFGFQPTGDIRPLLTPEGWVKPLLSLTRSTVYAVSLRKDTPVSHNTSLEGGLLVLSGFPGRLTFGGRTLWELQG